MPYCTLEDLLTNVDPEKLRQLAADDDGDLNGEGAQAIMAAVIAWADARVDEALNGRYDVPLSSPVPVLIRDIAAQYAVFRLFKRRREAISREEREAYDEAVKDLEALREGKMDIPGLAARSGGAAALVASTVTSAANDF